MNKITKKLQNLVKDRKTPVVVTKQGTVKMGSRASGSGNFGGDSYSGYESE